MNKKEQEGRRERNRDKRKQETKQKQKQTQTQTKQILMPIEISFIATNLVVVLRVEHAIRIVAVLVSLAVAVVGTRRVVHVNVGIDIGHLCCGQRQRQSQWHS